MQVSKKTISEDLKDLINNWKEYSEVAYGYSEQDARNFLKRFSISVYDSVLKGVFWFGPRITADLLVSWDSQRRKNGNALSNITEENLIVYSALRAVKDQIDLIKRWSITFNQPYRTRISYNPQTPMSEKEEIDFTKLYNLVLNTNYNWRQARDVLTRFTKLNIYENQNFPHNISDLLTVFNPTPVTYFQNFFPQGRCYYETLPVERRALEMAKNINENNLPILFIKPSEDYIEEYLRRHILSQYDIAYLIQANKNKDIDKIFKEVSAELEVSTKLSDSTLHYLFDNASMEELAAIAKATLLSLSCSKKTFNILDTAIEYQKNLNCYDGFVNKDKTNTIMLTNGERIEAISQKEIIMTFENIQKKYQFFYKNATDLEYVEGAVEILGKLLTAHSFKSGNKRTAKCIFNSLLISRGILPPIVDLNENQSKLWYDFIHSKDIRYGAVTPQILDLTTKTTEMFKNKEFTQPMKIVKKED